MTIPPISLCPVGERLAAAEEALDQAYSAVEAIIKRARYLSDLLHSDLMGVLSWLEQVRREINKARRLLKAGKS